MFALHLGRSLRLFPLSIHALSRPTPWAPVVNLHHRKPFHSRRQVTWASTLHRPARHAQHELRCASPQLPQASAHVVLLASVSHVSPQLFSHSFMLLIRLLQDPPIACSFLRLERHVIRPGAVVQTGAVNFQILEQRSLSRIFCTLPVFPCLTCLPSPLNNTSRPDLASELTARIC